MRKPFIHISIVFLSAVFFAYCKKEKTVPDSIALNIKTEKEIRSLMVGRWKVHYAINYSPPSVISCNECYWDISQNDSLIQVNNGALYSREKIVYSKNPYNGGTWLISATSPTSLSEYLLDSLRRDTLVSTYLFTGSNIYLTKQ